MFKNDIPFSYYGQNRKHLFVNKASEFQRHINKVYWNGGV